jgi:VWFA-related protein
MMLQPAKAQNQTIKLDVIARDSADNPVTGLKQQDFVVLDNGSSKAITSFAEVGKDDTPPTIVLVFDVINSPVTYATFQRQELTKFLRANEGKLAYPTVLTVVAPEGVSSSPTPTTDGNALAATLAKVNLGPGLVQRSSGGAAAQQRVNLSIKALNETLGSAGKFPGRKLVLYLSPGWALMGGEPMAPEQEKEMFAIVKNYSTGMRQTRVTLYMLNTQGAGASVSGLQAYRQYLKGVNDVRKTDFADMSLQVLATQSGGLVLNSNDLGVMMQTCLKDADQHYEIEFPASGAEKNVAFHEVQVKVNRPNVGTRTRNGYYAP